MSRQCRACEIGKQRVHLSNQPPSESHWHAWVSLRCTPYFVLGRRPTLHSGALYLFLYGFVPLYRTRKWSPNAQQSPPPARLEKCAHSTQGRQRPCFYRHHRPQLQTLHALRYVQSPNALAFAGSRPLLTAVRFVSPGSTLDAWLRSQASPRSELREVLEAIAHWVP
ncbi:hypothetical protein EDB84DRAFT_1473722 [Lactarius hengduanensis]|nr:hypothetical protein EDB84DRAFT_1473722 [Lactarius hengduanensis]